MTYVKCYYDLLPHKEKLSSLRSALISWAVSQYNGKECNERKQWHERSWDDGGLPIPHRNNFVVCVDWLIVY